MVYTKGECRQILRREIVKFAEGRSLKKFSIQKQVEYNGNKYHNREGLETGEKSGMWRLGVTISPADFGYLMILWSVVRGKVCWNNEIHFNSKMTPTASFTNTFMGSPLVHNGSETCEAFLSELLEEWGDGFMKSENDWTFN